MASFTIGYQNGFADSKKANGVGGQGWVSLAADRPTHLHAVGSVHTLHLLIVCSCIYSASNFEVKCAPCPRLPIERLLPASMPTCMHGEDLGFNWKHIFRMV
jgi:hypothetical protein